MYVSIYKCKKSRLNKQRKVLLAQDSKAKEFQLMLDKIGLCSELYPIVYPFVPQLTIPEKNLVVDIKPEMRSCEDFFTARHYEQLGFVYVRFAPEFFMEKRAKVQKILLAYQNRQDKYDEAMKKAEKLYCSIQRGDKVYCKKHYSLYCVD